VERPERLGEDRLVVRGRRSVGEDDRGDLAHRGPDRTGRRWTRPNGWRGDPGAPREEGDDGDQTQADAGPARRGPCGHRNPLHVRLDRDLAPNGTPCRDRALPPFVLGQDGTAREPHDGWLPHEITRAVRARTIRSKGRGV